jgi:energy-coupling factor transporter transmembrane protein EcfT
MILLDYTETPLSPHDTFVLIVVGIIIFVMWLLRNTPLGFLWRGFKIFMLVLFATLMANYLKKEIKEWWNKD